MENSSNWTNYQERLSRVTAYVYDHLDDELDLNKLADIACLSPYHWHRVYHATHGETIAATVKRLRLHRAAGYLAQTTMSVAEIARRSGYPNVASFNRIFSATYGMPPAQYRREGDHAKFRASRPDAGPGGYEIVIREMPDLQAVAVDHSGSYMQVGKAFDTLYGWLGARNHLTPGLRSIGMYLDDPLAVAEDRLRSKACVVVGDQFPVEAPVVRADIVGGPYAVLRHVGPYASMKAAYQWLYGEWLVQSGKEAANAPALEEYLNSPRDTPPQDLITDIWLPLSEA